MRSTPSTTPTGPARLDLDVLGPNWNDANDAKPGDAVPFVPVPHNSVYEIACRTVTWSVSPPAAGTLDDLGRPGAGVLFRAAQLPSGTPTLFATITATTVPLDPGERPAVGEVSVVIANTPAPRFRPGPTDPGVPLPPPSGRTLPPPRPSSTFPPYDWGTRGRPVVSPNPASAAGGGSILFSAGGVGQWEVCPAGLGSISSTGSFQASGKGVGFVIARGRRAGTFGDNFPGGIAIVVTQ